MAEAAPKPDGLNPAEEAEREIAERAGAAFLTYRDGGGRQQIVTLGDATARVTIGRGSATDIWLDWDEGVSRLHAELARTGDAWTVADDGLSSNGTFVNGVRVSGRRRLASGDTIRFGDTEMTFRFPLEADLRETVIRPDD